MYRRLPEPLSPQLRVELPSRRLLLFLTLLPGCLLDRRLTPDWLQVFEELQQFPLLQFCLCQLLSYQTLSSVQGLHLPHHVGQLALKGTRHYLTCLNTIHSVEFYDVVCDMSPSTPPPHSSAAILSAPCVSFESPTGTPSLASPPPLCTASLPCHVFFFVVRLIMIRKSVGQAE